MNSSQLKILACLLMLVDHIGSIMYPNILILRIIGRLSFPLFAFLITEGFTKTKDITDYLGRLFLFALISQIPFIYAFNLKGQPISLNVFFTLSMGLYALYSYDKYNKVSIVIFIAIVCQILNSDYGLYGVLLIFFFYKYKDTWSLMVRNIIFLTFGAQIIQFAIHSINLNANLLIGKMVGDLLIQPICLLSLIIIKKYNGKRGLSLRYFFYLFYPVHLIILKLIKIYL